MKKYFIIFIVCAVVFFAFYGHLKEMNYQFYGVVKKVTYRPFKPAPTITVNNKQFELVYVRWDNYKDSIEVGDTVEKYPGTEKLLLFKKKK